LTRTQRQIEEHRQANALVQLQDDAGRPCAGLPLWVEQEAHDFLFGCVVPDLAELSEADRSRYRARLEEVFNRLDPAASPPATGAIRVDVPDRVPLGTLRLRLDRLAAAGALLDVHVCGQTVGIMELSERDSGRRLVELYALCFAHPAVRGVFWNGLWDGEKGAQGGLLRRDLSPRPAFRLLQKLIDVVWHTRASGATDADGLFRFRGFCGDYRVGVRVGEHTEVARFSLRRGPDRAVPVRVVLPPAGVTPPGWPPPPPPPRPG
jgi:hypothetical protein